MHDTVEDTSITLNDIERIFGEKVKSIIDGLTKISGEFDFKSSSQAENFKKMFLTIPDDVRVILIKLATTPHMQLAVFTNLEEGYYNYTAFDGAQSWTGMVTILEGCVSIELN